MYAEISGINFTESFTKSLYIFHFDELLCVLLENM